MQKYIQIFSSDENTGFQERKQFYLVPHKLLYSSSENQPKNPTESKVVNETGGRSKEHAMSTVTLNYPDVIRVRRAPAIGQILILSTLALIGITILLTVISANADLNNRAAVSQDSVAAIPVPVPTPPTVDIQPIPVETPALSSGPASEPSIVPVPVPTPPSQ